MAPLTLVANLATRWRHLHKFQFWPPDGATCIGCKFGHQMAPRALVYITCITSLLWISLLALSASIELLSSSARVTSVKSNQTSLTEGLTYGPKDRTPGLPGSDKKFQKTKSIYFRNLLLGGPSPVSTHENVYEGLNAWKCIWRLKCSTQSASIERVILQNVCDLLVFKAFRAYLDLTY